MNLHRFSLLLAFTTFLLIIIGGLVTSKDAGLAVPDWPTTYGQNMFVFPFSKMVGGVLYEHSHRLIGALVGFLTIILAVWLWIMPGGAHGYTPLLRWMGVISLTAVVAQGILGGLRVTLVNTNLAIFHAAFAQAFFALTVSLALFTSPNWAKVDSQSRTPHSAFSIHHSPLSIQHSAFSIQTISLITTVLIFLQLIFGALLRHTGSRLDAHLLLAFLIAFFTVLIAVRVFRNHPDQPVLRNPTLLLSGFLILQLFLGLGSLLSTTILHSPFSPESSSGHYSLFQVVLTTAHVATGALLLATSLVLTLISYRLLAQPQKSPNFSYALQEIQK